MAKKETSKNLFLKGGNKKSKIGVVGIGGGGGNIVSELAPKIEKISFLVANTDLQALRSLSKKVIKFSFGKNLTKGLGTGMDPELAELAAKNEKEKIKKLFSKYDFLIFVSCLGGGVSSGATPIFVQVAKGLKNLTYGIFTLPFNFEGERKIKIAQRSLERLRPHLNAFSVIPNERIFEAIDKNTPLRLAFSSINKILVDYLEGLIETLYRPGLINIDFADLSTVLEGQGKLAFLNTLKIPRKRTISGAKEVLNSPLYPYSLKGAKNILFNVCGPKDLSLVEVSQISKTIFESVNPEAKIVFGISQDIKEKKEIKVTIFATGCSSKIFREKKEKTREKKRKKRKKEKKEKKEKNEKRAVKEPQNLKEKQRSGLKKKPKKKKPKLKKKKIKKEKKKTEKEEKVRRNALQIKEEIEKTEKEILKEEEKWEFPAFLKRFQKS